MKPLILDGHNFLVRTPIHMFLDSMEIPLSLESMHMKIRLILCPKMTKYNSPCCYRCCNVVDFLHGLKLA